MLHCPPSRINLANSDIAAFEQRFAAKQAAARLAQTQLTGPRLSAGPSRLARDSIVQADANAALTRADTYPSQAVICSDPEDEEEGVKFRPPRIALSPPTVQAREYDGARTTVGRPISSPAERESAFRAPPTARLQRRAGSIALQRQSLSPTALDGISERRLQPLTTHQTSWSPGPATLAARSSRQPSLRHDFVLYEESAHVQAQIEAQHQRRWHARRAFPEPEHEPHVAARPLPSHPVLATVARPIILPNLNPGAPAFIPRTRFGSGTGGSEENINLGTRHSRQGGPGARISSTQSTSNLRIRSSFERNSQQSYRRRDSHSASNPPSIPVARPVPPQHRRRSHTSDQNISLPSISTVGERYPALRPPTSIPAPRRGSGSHRQVIFPRRSSRMDLVDYDRADPPTQPDHDQRRSSSQSKTSSLAVPDGSNMMRASSAAPSSNSRSTPNLFRTASPPPVVHSRSSSHSWDRYVARQTNGYRVPSVVSAASGVSGSSGEHAHHMGHMPFEESMLSRGSPLDELMLGFGRFNMFPDDRPRSVGHSFQRPPGGPTRVSLLSGDIFRQESSSHEPSEIREHIGTGRHPLKAANDSSFSEDDAVAISLALPSPNMPSSSPMATSSSPILAPTPAQQRLKPTPRSSVTRSHHSVSSIIPEAQTTATPRVQIYDDRKSPRTQPQTPADINRSMRKAHSQATTMSRDEVGSVAGGLFSPVIPERRPHRPYTYPAGTPPSMVDGAAMPARTGIVSGQNSQQSLHVRGENRGSRVSENDVEGTLAGLDADRRTWMERREDGNLDVTPPREGRFERYLR